MRASRLLPSAAFGVAVGFFFVPPVLSLTGLMPVAARQQPRLEVLPGDGAAAASVRPARRTAMLQQEACGPASVPVGGAKARAKSVLALADPVR